MLRDLQQLPQAIRAYLQSLEPRHPYVVPDDKLEMFLEEVKQYRSRRVRDIEDFDHANEHTDSRAVGGASPEPIHRVPLDPMDWAPNRDEPPSLPDLNT